MKRKSIAFTMSAVVCCLSTGFAQFGNYKWNNSGSSLPTGMKHETYHSNLMNVDIGYNIYLPPNYNSTTDRYPVIYSLHGMGGNENSNCQAYGSVLQNGISSNKFPPVIVVFVNGRGNTFYSDSKDGAIKCESSIIKELIPKIDATYRTKADRTQRAIEGISMGGFGALMLGFKYPDMFTSIGSYDAALVTWDTLSQQSFDQSIPRSIFGNDRQYFNENSYPFTFAKKNAETIKSLGIKVRMITGDNDVQMGPLYNYNCAMRDTLKKLNIDLVEFKIIKGGTHGAGMNATTINENMIFHTNNFKDATPVINSSVSLSQKKSTYSHSIAIKTNSFDMPAKLHNAALYDLKGRNLGRIPMNGADCLDNKPLQKKVSSGIYMLRAGN